MRASLSDLDADVQAMAGRLLFQCAEQGIKLVITHTYRSPKQQAEIYAQGRTKPGKIVTHAPPGYSWHEFRRAFDVAIESFPGDMTKRDLYDGPWEVVGDIGEKVGLEWGGRWKNPDKPHFQHTGGFTLAHMRAKREKEAGGFA